MAASESVVSGKEQNRKAANRGAQLRKLASEKIRNKMERSTEDGRTDETDDSSVCAVAVCIYAICAYAAQRAVHCTVHLPLYCTSTIVLYIYHCTVHLPLYCTSTRDEVIHRIVCYTRTGMSTVDCMLSEQKSPTWVYIPHFLVGIRSKHPPPPISNEYSVQGE